MFVLSWSITLPASADVNSKLLSAANEGNIAEVQRLIDQNAEVNAKSHSGQTALMYAANKGYFPIFKILLDKNANIDIKDNNGYTALALAALFGHTKIVRALIDQGAKVNITTKYGFSALRLAKDEGHKTIVELLKKAGAKEITSPTLVEYKINVQSSKIQTKKKASPESVSSDKKMYLDGWCYLGEFNNEKGKWSGKTIKGYPARIPKTGEKVISKIGVHFRDNRPHFPLNKKGKLIPPYIVPAGAELTIKKIDANVGSNSVWAKVQLPVNIHKLVGEAKRTDQELLNVTKEGRVDDLLKTLEKKPDPDARYKDGMTPLIMAAKKGYLSIVKILLNKGADFNAEANDGWTALMSAAWKGNHTIVQILLDKGANINKKSSNGWTALTSASKYGHTYIVEALLAHGADVRIKGKGGKTALRLARERGNAQVIEVLMRAGAK